MFTNPQEVMDYIKALLENSSIEFKYIGYGDERLLPNYPAVVVDSGPFTRELHGTHTFLLHFIVTLWVYHANLSATHQVRTQEELELVKQITALLHEDMKFGGNIVFGHVASEAPGIFQRPKGDRAVGTRMTWLGTTQERF